MGQCLSQLCGQKDPCIKNDNIVILCCNTNSYTDWVDGKFEIGCNCLQKCRKDKS